MSDDEAAAAAAAVDFETPWTLAALLSNHYLHVEVVSCLVYLVIFKYVSPTVSSLLIPQYTSKLEEGKRADWNIRINSCINALLMFTLCLYAFLTDHRGLFRDPVWYDSSVVRTSSALMVGYTIADSILLFCYWKETGEVAYIFHHGTSIFAYQFNIVLPILPLFANLFLLSEFSTPFVNVRWYLDELGLKSSRLYMVNGVSLALAFLSCRILTIPFLYAMIWRWYGTTSWSRLGSWEYIFLPVCVTQNVVNVYWMIKIVRGAVKTLRAQGKTS